MAQPGKTEPISLDELQANWAQVKRQTQVPGGAMTFDHDDAKAAMKACDELAKNLERVLNEIKDLTNLAGFGSFVSSNEAAGFYGKQGTTWLNQVRQCRLIALEMSAAFDAAGKSLGSTETANRTAIMTANDH